MTLEQHLELNEQFSLIGILYKPEKNSVHFMSSLYVKKQSYESNPRTYVIRTLRHRDSRCLNREIGRLHKWQPK